MAKYRKLSASVSNKQPIQAPQTEQIPGTEMNNAGGYSYKISKWESLDRFLILGSEGGTYYVTEQKLTLDNVKSLLECISEDGQRVVDRIVEVSDKGLAAKNDPALFALAICASHGDIRTKKLALSALPKVARIGTHLFQFAHYVDGHRGWGKSLRDAISNWYNNMPVEKLSYQVIKYPSRTVEEGNTKSRWSHDDLLRKAHSKGDDLHNLIYQYITKENKLPAEVPSGLKILEGNNLIKQSKSAVETAELIQKYSLPHEVVPKEYANDPDVWKCLLPNLPLHATLRVLNRLTAYDVIKPLSKELNLIINRLSDKEQIKKSRIHPISVLSALKTYSSGQGIKGDLKWKPIPQIVDALNSMLYNAFDFIEPTGKNILFGLDVSGSMSCSLPNLPYVSCREGTAVLAMASARVEKNYHIFGFCDTFVPLNISPNQRLDDVVNNINRLNFGSTDCSLPMKYAMQNKLDVDAFVVLTDSETFYGDIHPSQALIQYRNKMNKPKAKLIVVGMVSNNVSIADPQDKYSLDVVGFDSSAPSIISNFIRAD